MKRRQPPSSQSSSQRPEGFTFLESALGKLEMAISTISMTEEAKQSRPELITPEVIIAQREAEIKVGVLLDALECSVFSPEERRTIVWRLSPQYNQTPVFRELVRSHYPCLRKIFDSYEPGVVG